MKRAVGAETSSPDTTVTESFTGFMAADIRVPALTVLAHPDAGRVGELVRGSKHFLGREGKEVWRGRNRYREWLL